MVKEQGLKLSQTFACKAKAYKQCATPAVQNWGEVYGLAKPGTAAWEHLTQNLAEGGSVPPGGGNRSGRNLPSQGFPFIWHMELSSTRNSGLVDGSSSVRRAKHSGISTGRICFTCQRGQRITGAYAFDSM